MDDLEEAAEWFRTALDMIATGATADEKSRLVRQSHVPDERDSMHRFIPRESECKGHFGNATTNCKGKSRQFGEPNY